MVALLKERGYTIKRNYNEDWWVDERKGKITRQIKGGATSSTPASQQSQAEAALKAFLNVAPRKPYAIFGTVASGTAGGQASIVNWTQQIPIIPSFCTAIDFEVVLPVNITTAAASTLTVSQYAPFSALWTQLQLGGAPPWPLTEDTPWYLDYLHNKINYDQTYPDLGMLQNNTPPYTQFTAGGTGGIYDAGPTPIFPLTQTTAPAAPGPWSAAFSTTAGTAPPVPNGVIPASTTATEIFQFKMRIQLQRKRHLLWGAVPFGDPENRPLNLTQIGPLLGPNPEQNLFSNSTGTVTATIATGCTVKAIYELAYIDLLPPNMNVAPSPGVAFGLQMVPSTTSGMAAATLVPVTHRTAMVYTHIHHLLINNQAPLRPDYIGLWDDQDQQSARTFYDANVNTQNQYWTRYKDTYRRYPIAGHVLFDFVNGIFPEIPSVTPYDALMSPDSTYAAAFGIPVTPAMTTTVRFPGSLTNPYLRNYELGLVRVPY